MHTSLHVTAMVPVYSKSILPSTDPYPGRRRHVHMPERSTSAARLRRLRLLKGPYGEASILKDLLCWSPSTACSTLHAHRLANIPRGPTVMFPTLQSST